MKSLPCWLGRHDWELGPFVNKTTGRVIGLVNRCRKCPKVGSFYPPAARDMSELAYELNRLRADVQRWGLSAEAVVDSLWPTREALPDKVFIPLATLHARVLYWKAREGWE